MPELDLTKPTLICSVNILEQSCFGFASASASASALLDPNYESWIRSHLAR